MSVPLDLPEWAKIALMIGGVAVAIVYVLPPLMMWLGLRLSPDATFEPVAAGEIDPRLRAHVDRHATWLAGLGFEPGPAFSTTSNTGLTTITLRVAPHYDRHAGRSAGLVVASLPSGPAGPPLLWFNTVFGDGTTVQVVDTPDPILLPTPPRLAEWHVGRVPREELWRLFLAAERHRPEPGGAFGRSGIRHLPTPGAEVEEEAANYRAEMIERENLARWGRLPGVRPARGGGVRPTLAQSFIGAWRAVFPLKHLRIRRDRRRLRRLAAASRDSPAIDRPPRVEHGLPPPVRRVLDPSA